MITATELTTVTESMQGLVARGNLPEFDRVQCNESAREVIFIWEREKLAVIVEIDGNRTTEQQLDAAFASHMSMN